MLPTAVEKLRLNEGLTDDQVDDFMHYAMEVSGLNESPWTMSMERLYDVYAEWRCA